MPLPGTSSYQVLHHFVIIIIIAYIIQKLETGKLVGVSTIMVQVQSCTNGHVAS